MYLTDFLISTADSEGSAVPEISQIGYLRKVGPKLLASFTHNKQELALAHSFQLVNSFCHMFVERYAPEKCNHSQWYGYAFFPNSMHLKEKDTT